MKPEEFIRAKLRKLYGEEAVKIFDKGIAEGLRCELCRETKTTVAIRPFNWDGVKYSFLCDVTKLAMPKDSKEITGEIVPAVNPALCEECFRLCESGGEQAH